MFEGINPVTPIQGIQGMQGIQGIQGLEETQGLQDLQALMAYRSLGAASEAERSRVKEEFLAIFYKELLKQTFKPPKFGIDNEENNSMTSTFGSDLLVERMALELAQSGAFSAEDLFPTEIGR
jgi:hypothetical protein